MDTMEYVRQLRRGIETSNGLLIDLAVTEWLEQSGIFSPEWCKKRNKAGTLFQVEQRDTAEGVG